MEWGENGVKLKITEKFDDERRKYEKIMTKYEWV